MRFRRRITFLFLVSVFLVNIGSFSINFPPSESQSRTTFKIHSLRGELGVYRQKTDPYYELHSVLGVDSIGDDIIQAPIRYNIVDGVIDDVDINTSNVDSISDIGDETNFDYAQGTSVDSQYMQIQEVAGEAPAIQIDSISTFSGNDTNTFNINHSVSGINRLLLIFIQIEKGANVTSVSFGGSPLTLLIRNESFVKVPAGPRIEIWQLKDPDLGFNNGTVILAGLDDVAIQVVSYTGVDQDIPIDGARSLTGKSFDTSISIASRSGDLAQDTMASSATGIPVEAVGQTRWWATQIGTTGHYGVGSTKPGASSVTFGWTTPGDKDWVHVAFNIRKASAPYHSDHEYQWTSAEYTRQEEELAIYSGDLGEENLSVQVWTGTQWIEIIQDLESNAWKNVSVNSYLDNSNFTIRLRSEVETNDPSADIWNIDLILLVVSVENTAPSVSNITFSPEPVRSNDTLTLSYNFTDVNSDLESGTQIKWYKWNETSTDWDQKFAENLTKNVIESIYLHKDDIWKCEIKPNDGIDFGNTSSKNVTIHNTPPIASNVRLKGVFTPRTEDDIEIEYDWFDVDYNDMDQNTSIIWYRNRTGVFQPLPNYENFTLLPSNETLKGDMFYLNITPSDGYGMGISVVSNNIIIRNTPPVLSMLIKNDTLWIPEGTSVNFNDTTDLEVNYTAYDVDFDFLNPLTLEISWLLFNSSSSKFEWKVNDTKVLGRGNTTQDDLWIVKMRISDGTNYSEWKSRSITIGETPNQVPTATNVNLDSSNAIAGGLLNASYDYFDPDGDDPGILPYFHWYKWNGSFWAFQSQFGVFTQVLTTAVLTKGDIWRVEVRPQDNNTDYGAWSVSSNITISNTAPYIVSATIFPSSNVYTTDTLLADYLANDVDNDQITTISIVWKNGTQEVQSLMNSTEVPASYTRKDQIWYYIIRVSDGEQWSENYTITIPSWINIQNSAPHIENVTLVGGQTTEDNITLDYLFVDADGDPESTIDTIITWKIFHIDHFIVNPPDTKSLPSSWFTAGDLIYCTIEPSDGYFGGDGSLVDTSSLPGGFIVVRNSPPELISDPNILNSEGLLVFTVGQDLKVNYSVLDPDQGEGLDIYWTSTDLNGYVVGAQYRWYRNDTLMTDLQESTVDKTFLQKGDRWRVGVKPQDRYGWYGSWKYSEEITINNSKMEVSNLRFEDHNTGNPLNDTTDSYVNLSIFYNIRDPDVNDTLQDYEILWYRDSGNGSFLLMSAFSNQTIGPSAELERGQQWYVEIRVFDGEEWSEYQNTSIIRIVNSLPIISTYDFHYTEDSSIINRIEGYYVIGEDIVLTYHFEDLDNDLNWTSIRWFKQLNSGSWIEMIEFENTTIVTGSNTQAEEIWYASIVPHDGIEEGLSVNSSYIYVISRPSISIAFPEPDISMDGKFNLMANVTDISNHETLIVKFQIPSINSTKYNASYLGSGYWSLSINLIDWLNTDITVNVEAYSTIGSTFQIYNYTFFDFIIKDEAPPRVTKLDNLPESETNPTYVEFFIVVEEFGSDIEEVILFYNFSEVDSSLAGFGSQFGIQYSIKMEFYNNTNGIVYYYGKVDLPSFDQDVILSYRIQTNDTSGKVDPQAIMGGLRLDYAPQGLSPGLLLAVIVILTGAFLSVGSGYMLYRRRSEEKRSMVKRAKAKLSFFSDTYQILVSSISGIPIWSISNISYSTDDALEGTISGLSVGIDSFLESFQSDFMSTLTNYELTKDHPDHDKNIRISVIEQREVKIMILGSASYRIFVFMKEAPSTYIRERFLEAIEDLQHKLPIQDLGFINENILGPNVRMVIKKHVPVSLLTPFKVDIERLNHLDSTLRQGLEDGHITRGGLDAIKLLLIAARSTDLLNKSASSLLKLYTEADFSEEFSGIFLFSDGLQILSKIPGLSIEDICDAFWLGASEKVKILIPV